MNITFQNVSAGYGPRQILNGVRFTVPAGSITALVGLNGAGKSTLLRCLMGEKSYSGSICVGGEDLAQMDRTDRVRNIACLPQNLPRPHVTVEQLVSFGRTPYTSLVSGLRQEDRQAVDRAIKAVGLEGYAQAVVDTLSGGERKKAFFAMVLAQDTPVVLLDEPTAHLDAVSRFELLRLLQKQTGKTFLVVAHELPELLRCADHMVVLEKGRVAFEGTPEDCLQEQIPQRCFRVRITGNREEGFAVTPTEE